MEDENNFEEDVDMLEERMAEAFGYHRSRRVKMGDDR
jgi:hypothetical protein